MTRYDPSQYEYKPDPSQEKYDKIDKEINTELKEHNYHVLSATIGGFDQDVKVELEVPDTENHIKEIKEIVKNVLAKNKEEKMSIKVYKINLKKREQDRKSVV